MSEDAEQIVGCSPGIGSIPNCFFGLVNVDEIGTKFSNAGLHRSRDPGAGAFSPYYDRISTATRAIAKGEEIFVHYGTNYFKSREEYLGYIATPDDYESMDGLLMKFDKKIRRDPFLKSLFNTNDLTAEEVYDAMSFVLNTTNPMFEQILPEHDVLDEMLAAGVGFLHFNRSIQDYSWLEENGRCMDNIVVGTSRIHQAGRGAFARRNLTKGSIVAPLPLLQVPREHLVMYAEKRNTTTITPDRENPVHHQLLLNYCFSHPRSDLLLCPHGVATMLLNHSPEPNVMLAWNDALSSHPEWRTLPPKEWIGNFTAGLVMDLIAIRDISEGEELYLDYGPTWQNAWEEHIAKWKPSEDAKDYIDAHDLNTMTQLDLRIGLDAYKDVTMHCHGEYLEFAGLGDAIDEEEDYRCYVLRRDGDLYATVLVHPEENEDQGSMMIFDAIAFLPRDAFFFRNIRYSRDYQKTSSFRHEIGLPADLFPEPWMRKPN